MWSYDLTLLVIVLQTLCHSGHALVSCNETVSKVRLCSLVPDYKQGLPPAGKPLELLQSITLFSIAEINEDLSSMTLNVLLAMLWNDSRLSLKANNPEE